MAEKDSAAKDSHENTIEVHQHFLKENKQDIPVNNTKKPKFPQYEDTEKRADSFKNWPTRYPIKSEAMIKAGLVYTGQGDKVTCFCCGGSLSNWNYGEDPGEEHAEWYPTCPLNTIDAVVEEKPQETDDHVMLENVEMSNVARSEDHQEDVKPEQGSAKEPIELFKERQTDCRKGVAPPSSDHSVIYQRTREKERAEVPKREARGIERPDNELPEKESVGHLYPDSSPQMKNDVKCEYNTNLDQGLPEKYTAWKIQPMKDNNQHYAGKTPSASSSKDDELKTEKLFLQTEAGQSCLENNFTDTQILQAVKILKKERKDSSKFTGREIAERILQFESDKEPGAVGGRVEPLCNSCRERERKEGDREETEKLLYKGNQKLKNILMCRMCLDNVVGIVFLPCGHLVCCHECGHNLVKCLRCGLVINGTVRAYLE